MDPAVALIRTTLNTASLAAPGLAGRAAFGLYRHPFRRSRVRPGEHEVHDRAVTGTIRHGDARVAVYSWGDGARPVLLMHGWRSRASRFAHLVPRLRALGLTAVGYDAPGHGDSGGRTATVLDHRALALRLQERYGDFEAVVAHSLGVNAAFLALREGLRAERLVAFSGASELSWLPTAFCDRLGLNATVERELRRREAGGAMFPGVADIRTHFDAAREPGEIALPILVAHDEDDDVVPFSHARRLRAAYGERLELVATRGLGHRRILVEPTVLDQVTGFLAAGAHPGGRTVDGPGEAVGAI
ncbi:Lysophospholipase, alpha-beta hydrolase superfamily [Streptomyces sp. TLI_053]|uniref:alpha/beta hydrolase n=1 Tax=Streptomyces sp. TLI_053 TaxID=1855352 RepID=UPI00087D84BC|nr:alpha/beta hydrolase [Streptomyces sp. TLI_053]SDT71618.1 Lysophospholipase, alpha-beta hydrolase superfamily [Streptomyces sp. TLI_053]